MTPACAKACPTESIQFGDLDELRARAGDRVRELHEAGVTDAYLYGDDPAAATRHRRAARLLPAGRPSRGVQPAAAIRSRPARRSAGRGARWRRVGRAAATAVAVGGCGVVR